MRGGNFDGDGGGPQAPCRRRLVDVNTLTFDHLSKIGKDAAMKYYVISTGWKKSMDDEPAKDTSHTIDAGADMWAKVFVEDVKKRNLEIAELFK